MEDNVITLTEEELAVIQKGTTEYTKIKISLGELELQKQGLIIQANKIKDIFSKNEKLIIDKYGEDAVINIQTGEVRKRDGDN